MGPAKLGPLNRTDELRRLIEMKVDLDRLLVRQAGAGNTYLVKLLLEAGASVHACKDEALKYASYYGQLEVVSLLLDNGADVHAEDDNALRCASENGHLSVVNLLLEYGADVHAENNEALIWASHYGHLEVVESLKQHYLDNGLRLPEEFI